MGNPDDWSLFLTYFVFRVDEGEVGDECDWDMSFPYEYGESGEEKVISGESIDFKVSRFNLDNEIINLYVKTKTGEVYLSDAKLSTCDGSDFEKRFTDIEQVRIRTRVLDQESDFKVVLESSFSELREAYNYFIGFLIALGVFLLLFICIFTIFYFLYKLVKRKKAAKVQKQRFGDTKNGSSVHQIMSYSDNATFADVRSADSNDNCAVCMSSFGLKDQVNVMKECGHIIHSKCLEEWLSKVKNGCPSCNIRIKETFL
jgi:cbb3-type cytochrome oxidase subunit 3